MRLRAVQVLVTSMGLALCGTAITSPATAAPPRGVYPVGVAPNDVVMSDFDGDGELDLAVTAGRFVDVLLGDGRGGYGAATRFPVGGSSAPGAVAVGDFNGDGDADLVTANSNDGSVSVLRGRPGGAFSAPAKFTTPSLALVDVAVGDINDDGDLDVAVGDNRDGVYVLLGTGTGGLGVASTVIPAAEFGGIDALALNDVNVDGALDLVVTRQLSGTVAVLLGDGAGGFSAPTSFAAIDPILTFIGLAVADLDGDGNSDLAITDNGTSPQDGVAVLLGDGEGGFGSPATFAVGRGPTAVTAADFNGDGLPDLAVANGSSNNVSLLIGNGAGAFTPPINFASRGEGPTALAAGDVEPDGDVDLAVVNNFSNTVAVGLNRAGPVPGVSFGSPR